jgi:type I restriction enzyme R subunit
MTKPNEDTLEYACIEWLESLNYEYLHGTETIDSGYRNKYSDVLLQSIVKDKLKQFNPQVPNLTIDEVYEKLNSLNSLDLNKNNQKFHNYLVNGITVSYEKNGEIVDDIVKLIDFNNPDKNDFKVVNQFTVILNDNNKRPDLVIFLNGFPIGIFELKNMFDEDATIMGAYNQLQTYKEKISDLFYFNELMVISDGFTARVGSLTADFERYAPWRTFDGLRLANNKYLELEVLTKGIFTKSKVLDLIKNFVTYKETDESVIKIVAMYHQIGAVNKALESTIKAVSSSDKRAGVIWHTQGSGKSFSMLFFASKLAKSIELNNPTIIVLTDRNDLDNQLFGNFSTSPDLLRGVEQTESVKDLEKMLQKEAGGIIFTTMQKFRDDEYKNDAFNKSNDRENIIVIADEAHRSQYGTKEGYARNVRLALPNATFIGFTGTPIDMEGKSTINVFGDLIDVYDIEQAVEDGATVRIYYEARLAKLDLVNPEIDEDYEDINESVEEDIKQKEKSKWAALEKVIGSKDRLEKIGVDIVEHFNHRELEGKAMIVVMSRQIAVDLYNIIKNVPNAPEITCVMTTNSSDNEAFNEFKRNKKEQKEIEKRFKDPNDSLKIVIVRDMWLTGFDVPCLHTMYIDKPMKGHNLMQAIARVNRVFKDKEGGLIVDYIGIASDLKKALAYYTEGGIKTNDIPDIDEVIGLLKDKLEILREFFKGFLINGWLSKSKSEQLYFVKQGADHILDGGDENKKEFAKESEALIKLFSLLPYSEDIERLREERIYYETVRGLLIKNSVGIREKTVKETAIKQLINESITSKGVIDIFEEVGSHKPDISILSDEFLEEIKGIEFKNIQIEILRKIINDEIKIKILKNVVKYRNLKELLEKSIKSYHNRNLTSAEIIQKLIEMAKDIKSDDNRCFQLGLTPEECAFYDTIREGHETIMSDDELRGIVRKLIESIRNNLKIDWSSREDVKANIRSTVKRILRRSDFKKLPEQEFDIVVANVILQAEGLWKDFKVA